MEKISDQNVERIRKEPLKIDWEKEAKKIDTCDFAEALDKVTQKVRNNLKEFTDKFPSAGGVNGEYKPTENADDFLYSDWTSSFWTGMIWQAYEITGDEIFKEVGLRHTKSFRCRLDQNIVLDHHDIGFLYTLSCEAAYKLTGDALSGETAMLAAKKLSERFNQGAGIIQCGPGVNSEIKDFTGRYIIDTCLNIPLLYWASEYSGDQTYFNMAKRHIENVIQYNILDSGATEQTVILDSETGRLISRFTHQGDGENKNACWSRGQAWAIYGLAISGRYLRDDGIFEICKRLCHYFLNRLQSDFAANWDFCYQSDNDQRDTSAVAITVCGLLELCRNLAVCDSERKIYECAAKVLTHKLMEHYWYTDAESKNAILKSGVYGYKMNLCVNEPVIWGDYYFMESLVRLVKHNRAFL